MSKKLVAFGVVAVLGLSYVGATAYVGSKTEAVVRQQVAEVNTKLADELSTEITNNYAKFTILSFERNIFKSEAIVQFEFNIADEITQQLEFKDVYYHGPLPLAAIGAGKFAPALSYSHTELLRNADSELWFEAAKGEVPFVADTVYGFGGGASSDMVFAPTKFDIEDEAYSIETAKATLQLKAEKNIANHSLQGSLPLVSFKSAYGQDNIVINDLSMQGSGTEKSGEITSEYNALIKRLDVSVDAGAPVYITDFSMVGAGRQKDDIVDGSVVYRIGELKVEDHNLGSFELNTHVKNLDYTVLKEMNDLTFKSDVNMEEAMEPLLRKLLAKKPEISVSPFLWRNSGGDARVEFSTILKPVEPEVGLDEAIDRVDISLSLSRDMVLAILGDDAGFLSSMVEMIFDGKVQELSEQKLISYTDNVARLDIKYNSDTQRVLLNEQDLTLEEFAVIVGSQAGPLLGF